MEEVRNRNVASALAQSANITTEDAAKEYEKHIITIKILLEQTEGESPDREYQLRLLEGALRDLNNLMNQGKLSAPLVVPLRLLQLVFENEAGHPPKELTFSSLREVRKATLKTEDYGVRAATLGHGMTLGLQPGDKISLNQILALALDPETVRRSRLDLQAVTLDLGLTTFNSYIDILAGLDDQVKASRLGIQAVGTFTDISALFTNVDPGKYAIPVTTIDQIPKSVQDDMLLKMGRVELAEEKVVQHTMDSWGNWVTNNAGVEEARSDLRTRYPAPRYIIQEFDQARPLGSFGSSVRCRIFRVQDTTKTIETSPQELIDWANNNLEQYTPMITKFLSQEIAINPSGTPENAQKLYVAMMNLEKAMGVIEEGLKDKDGNLPTTIPSPLAEMRALHANMKSHYESKGPPEIKWPPRTDAERMTWMSNYIIAVRSTAKPQTSIILGRAETALQQFSTTATTNLQAEHTKLNTIYETLMKIITALSQAILGAARGIK